MLMVVFKKQNVGF